MDSQDKILVISQRLRHVDEYLNILKQEESLGYDWSKRIIEYTAIKNTLEALSDSIEQ